MAEHTTAEMPLRVLHLTPSIGRASFGLGQVAVNLAKAQNDLNIDARIWCLDNDDQIEWAVKSSGLDRDKVSAFPSFGPPRLGFSPAMFSTARSDRNNFDVVHQHGIWTACSHVSNILHSKHHIPVVVAPHGSLDAWALRRSWRKKQLALSLYEHKNLHNANCLHALSEREAAGFRDFGLRNPIAVIPNGIAFEWTNQNADRKALRKELGIPEDTKIMLFLGRITPKKGLPMLLKSMQRIQQSLTDWLLLIAGVDEFNHQSELERLVETLSLNQYVRFIGPRYDQAKREVFAAADLFVLPSNSEGVPMAILEALGAGVPILTTKASPCEYLTLNRCGWCTEISENAISEALKTALRMPRDVLHEMGQRGRTLAQERFTWDKIAEQTISLYQWLLGRGQRPDFVIED